MSFWSAIGHPLVICELVTRSLEAAKPGRKPRPCLGRCCSGGQMQREPRAINRRPDRCSQQRHPSAICAFPRQQFVSCFYPWEAKTKVEKKPRRRRNPNRNPNQPGARSLPLLRRSRSPAAELRIIPQLIANAEMPSPRGGHFVYGKVSQSGLTLRFQFPWSGLFP